MPKLNSSIFSMKLATTGGLVALVMTWICLEYLNAGPLSHYRQLARIDSDSVDARPSGSALDVWAYIYLPKESAVRNAYFGWCDLPVMAAINANFSVYEYELLARSIFLQRMIAPSEVAMGLGPDITKCQTENCAGIVYIRDAESLFARY
jgi:hypothetical protein